MAQFLYYSGVFFWIILIITLILRLLLGKSWLQKIGLTLIAGPGLIQSFKKLYREYPREIKKDTLAELSAQIVWRLTRIGVIGLVIAGLPVWLLMQQNRLISSQTTLMDKQTRLLESQDASFKKQNELFETQNINLDTQSVYLRRQNDLLNYQNTRSDKQISLMDYQNTLLDNQNYRLNLQNNLIEAERRGALVILMGNILDQIDAEIQSEKEDKLKKGLKINLDTIKYNLSDPLIGRIVGLSQGFLPYRYLEGDTLTPRAVSPERGQLLLALINSGLNSVTLEKIYESAKFEFAYFNDANLKGAFLKEINLNGADLRNANLAEANLWGAYLMDANLSRATLEGTDLRGAILTNANLGGALLLRTDLSFAYLLRDYHTMSEVAGVNFEGAELVGVKFSTENELTVKQLSKAKRIDDCESIADHLLEELKETKPCLFSYVGCSDE